MTETNKPELNYEAAVNLLGSAPSILLVSHEFTDGDDLGALLALRYMLVEKGKKVFAVSRGGVPQNLLFMPGAQEVSEELPPPADYQLTALLGCGSLERHGFPDWQPNLAALLNIDHHPDNKMFGSVNLVNPSASANSEIVYGLIQKFNHPISKAMATDLLTGIFTDTGGFRHASTTAEVLEITADLMRHGARIERISNYTFRNLEMAKLKAWAKALENSRFDEKQKMVYSIVTEEELAAIGAKPEHLEGVAEILNTIPEANFSLLLKQRGDEIRGSLRSENYKGVDVSKIARSYGGGGHKLAAGFKLKGRIEKTEDGWKIT